MKKIDLETLKTIATSTPLKPALDNIDPFAKINKFVTLFKIKDGKNKVPASLAYKVYSDWAETPVSKVLFYREFGKLFLSEQQNHKAFYSLNYKPGGLVKKGQELKDLRDITVE